MIKDKHIYFHKMLQNVTADLCHVFSAYISYTASALLKNTKHSTTFKVLAL